MDAIPGQHSDVDQRDHFIPIRKSDILRALDARGILQDEHERAKFHQLCRLLGAIYHYDYLDELERLRDNYFYFNPELIAPRYFDAAAVGRAYRDMIAVLEQVLHGANFVEVSRDEIERAHREHALVRVDIETPTDDYRDIRFFRRGRHRETIEFVEWCGLRKRRIDADVYDDVVLLVTAKDAEEIAADGRVRSTRKVRPGAVLLKYFRNIASADLNALFPEVRVVMGLRDKLVLGVPAVVGGIPILLKVSSTATVLVLVAGFYLGISSAVGDDQMAAALAGVSGLMALGGFVVRQWVKFQRQSLLYQKQLADTVYFRNVNNNAGIFDHLIGAAEDQDCKEAFLAYHFLLAAPDALDAAALDRRIESWLKDCFGIDVDFECDDALVKLDRLGLLRRDSGRLAVLPLDAALLRLHQVWDDFFPRPAPS